MANNHKLRRFRKVAARRQQHRCHYCDAPMWTKIAWAFAERHGLRLEDCVHFQCTAEHVIARRDGGVEVRNIVAACRHCNLTRHETAHPLPAEVYREHVRSNVAESRWLTRSLLSTRHSRESGNPERSDTGGDYGVTISVRSASGSPLSRG
jgi:5-methylcytosine-specific restriction endonuclease McrA